VPNATQPKATDEVEQIRCALRRCSIVAPGSNIVVDRIARELSSLWHVVVSDGSGKKKYIAKRAGAEKHRQSLLTRRQSELLSSMADSCVDLADFQSLYVDYDADTGLLILKESDLPPLSTHLAGFPLLQGLRGFPKLTSGTRRAGQWLRHWHAATRRTGNTSQALSRYIRSGRRSAGLCRLPNDTRQAFVEVVETFPDGEVVTTHGDFTMFNFLTDGQQISVIDPGVWEWRELTPCWDVCTFMHSLESQLRLRRWSSLLARNKTIEDIQREFLHAYGDGGIENSRAYLICSAVRCFTCFYAEQDRAIAAYNLDRLRDRLSALRRIV
jgi:hypothetical protein